MKEIEVCIIGGGIVGLATAYTLSQQEGISVTVLEKEDGLAEHQTGRNSGVIHSGIYYKPGSRKAVNCRSGKALLEKFCEEYGVSFDRCGKVIVATHERELPKLKELERRGQENGVECRMIGVEELHQLEPHCTGIQALHVPETGIVDYRGVCEKFAELIQAQGGRVVCSSKVTGIKEEADGIQVESGQISQRFDAVVNCAGLYSDKVARMAGVSTEADIIPFRGEYFELKESARHLCRNLIYPVPDPEFPFLGVHFTRMIGDEVECGPNAVLAFGREAYGKLNFHFSESMEIMKYSGFWPLIRRHWKMGLGEFHRSFSKAAFVRALQRLIPEITAADLVAAAPGIRAQALAHSGDLVDDFLFAESARMIHVFNAPSPAATASLAIAKQIVERFEALAPRLNEAGIKSTK
jgi:(S)-2-hydroxyglutarate dehydrogenase